MPKVIENLHDDILRVAKEMLLAEGYQKFTMRRVAAGCHIAVGTLYNYFSSKDVLAANIMLLDWLQEMGTARTEIALAGSCMEGLGIIYDAIHRFSLSYEGIWGEYGGRAGISPDYHKRIVAQIEELVGLALNASEADAGQRQGIPGVASEADAGQKQSIPGAASEADAGQKLNGQEIAGEEKRAKDIGTYEQASLKRFLAEALLYAASRDDYPFAEIRPFLEKVVSR